MSPVILHRKTGFKVPVREWMVEGNPKAGIGNAKLSERGLRGSARLVYRKLAEHI